MDCCAELRYNEDIDLLDKWENVFWKRRRIAR